MSGAATTSTSPSGFGALRGRADQAHVDAAGVKRGEQYAWRGGDTPIKAELADDDEVRQGFGIDCAQSREKTQRDGKVEVRALLWQIGGT